MRQQQDEEDAARLKESEMVRNKAQLLRRCWRKVEARRREKKKFEDMLKQDTNLEEAYQRRLAQKSDHCEDEEGWDPIEDAVEDERGAFVDLMRALLWLERPSLDTPEVTPASASEV